MKKIILNLLFVGCSTFYFAQETVTNYENSEYKFTKVYSLESTPVLSQGHTGTCWSFSTLSFFESELIRKGIKNPDPLSQMFVARKAYEGKFDKFIRMDGKSNFSEGGAFHDIPWVIKNYGIVPMEVYKGLSYGTETHNHSEFFSVLNGAVHGLLSYMETDMKSNGLSNAWKEAFNGILDAYLGQDIKEFDYKGKKYTPKSYASSLGLNMDEYVSITSFTHTELNKKCFIEVQDNWKWGESYNVSLDELMSITENALAKGFTIAWAADVSELGFSRDYGVAIVPEDPSSIVVKGRESKNFSEEGASKKSNVFLTPSKELTITPELRQNGYDNKTTTDDHGMHIVGLYKDQNGTKYFLVKNSWGTKYFAKGYWYVSESYFKYKTMNIFLHKDGIDSKTKSKLNL